MNQPGTKYLLSDWQPLYQGIDYTSGVVKTTKDHDFQTAWFNPGYAAARPFGRSNVDLFTTA